MPEDQDEKNTANRLRAVALAQKKWNGAPLHIKAMAGDYVGPLLEAIYWIDHDLGILKKKVQEMSK